MDFEKSATANFERHLARNSYPGRVLVIGRGEDGTWLQLYAIMGRSEQSRNRRFVVDGPTLRTEAIDPSKVDKLIDTLRISGVNSAAVVGEILVEAPAKGPKIEVIA